MKKIKIIGVFLIFGLSFLSHFMYEWLPNTFFSIFFPVNESIWEHMKLLVTPVLIFSVFEYIIYKRKNINFNNFLLSYSISMILGIVIYLIIYLPLYYRFGEKCKIEMHESALDYLMRAGVCHAQLEEIYKEATDYGKVGSLSDKIVADIFA